MEKMTPEEHLATKPTNGANREITIMEFVGIDTGKSVPQMNIKYTQILWPFGHGKSGADKVEKDELTN